MSTIDSDSEFTETNFCERIVMKFTHLTPQSLHCSIVDSFRFTSSRELTIVSNKEVSDQTGCALIYVKIFGPQTLIAVHLFQFLILRLLLTRLIIVNYLLFLDSILVKYAYILQSMFKV